MRNLAITSQIVLRCLDKLWGEEVHGLLWRKYHFFLSLMVMEVLVTTSIKRRFGYLKFDTFLPLVFFSWQNTSSCLVVGRWWAWDTPQASLPPSFPIVGSDASHHWSLKEIWRLKVLVGYCFFLWQLIFLNLIWCFSIRKARKVRWTSIRDEWEVKVAIKMAGMMVVGRYPMR
jgi:hypothetical protein